jgi:hypothetical protein
MSKPKWATRERQEQLVRLWDKYGNKCLLGHPLCPVRDHYTYMRPCHGLAVTRVERIRCEDGHGNVIRTRDGQAAYRNRYIVQTVRVYTPETARLYEVKESEVIADWKADDREQRAYEQRQIQRALHRIPERGALRGTFNAISRTIYHDNQPQYYVESIGVSGMTIRPFAKVRLASSYTRVHVDLGDSLVKVSKNRKRKAIRYGKALPPEVQNDISTRCGKAVAHYLNS